MEQILKLTPKKAEQLIFAALTGAGTTAANARYFTEAILDTELSELASDSSSSRLSQGGFPAGRSTQRSTCLSSPSFHRRAPACRMRAGWPTKSASGVMGSSSSALSTTSSKVSRPYR